MDEDCPDQIYSCDECPKQFVRPDLLQRHKKRHEKGMWYRKIGGVVPDAARKRKRDDGVTADGPNSASPESPEDSEGRLPPPSSTEAETAHHVVRQIEPLMSDGNLFNPDLSGFDAFQASIGGVHPLFFDAAGEFQESNDMDWLLQDIFPETFQDNSIVPQLNPLQAEGPIQQMIMPIGHVVPDVTPIAYQEQAQPLQLQHMPASVWDMVRNNLMAELFSLPPEVLGTPFFDPGNLESFWNGYFDNYHPQFPLLHRPSLSPAEAPAFLVLAITTLGATLAPDVTHYNVATKIHDHMRGITFNVMQTNMLLVAYMLTYLAGRKLPTTRTFVVPANSITHTSPRENVLDTEASRNGSHIPRRNNNCVSNTISRKDHH